MFYYNITISINGNNEVTVHFVQFTILIALKFNLNLQGLLGNKKKHTGHAAVNIPQGNIHPKSHLKVQNHQSLIYGVCVRRWQLFLSLSYPTHFTKHELSAKAHYPLSPLATVSKNNFETRGLKTKVIYQVNNIGGNKKITKSWVHMPFF